MNKEKKKILLLIWSLDLGGAEQVVLNLAQGLDRKRFIPMVCCMNEKGRYASVLEEQGIGVFALHKKGKVDLGFVFRLADLIKCEKVDLIHSHLFSSNLWGRVAALMTKVPIVHTEHNVDVWKKSHHFWIDRLLSGVSRGAIFVSNKVREFYLQKVPSLKSKAHVFYNGIRVERFRRSGSAEALKQKWKIPAQAKVVGVVGRLVPQKAHKDFIESIFLLNQKGIHAVGLILGEGPLKEELQAFVRTKNMEDKIIFTGFLSEIAPMYQMMDLFSLSSYREGFPMTLLEAMAARVPCAATDVGGVNECVFDRQTGRLVPPGKPELLAQAMYDLLSDASLRQACIEKAYQRVIESCSLEAMARQHETLYLDVCQKN